MPHGFHDSCAVINGVEHDVRVEWRSLSNDPLPGYDIEVLCAFFEDEGCILNDLSEKEYEALCERVGRELEERGEP